MSPTEQPFAAPIDGENIARIYLYTDGSVQISFPGPRHLTPDQIRAIHVAADAAYKSWNPEVPFGADR